VKRLIHVTDSVQNDLNMLLFLHKTLSKYAISDNNSPSKCILLTKRFRHAVYPTFYMSWTHYFLLWKLPNTSFFCAKCTQHALSRLQYAFNVLFSLQNALGIQLLTATTVYFQIVNKILAEFESKVDRWVMRICCMIAIPYPTTVQSRPSQF